MSTPPRPTQANRPALDELLAGALQGRTTAEWEALLVPLGVPASAINDVAALKRR